MGNKSAVKNERSWMFVISTVCVVFALWKSRLGLHSDEVHSIAVGDMIAEGNSFFRECWFYLQMSSVFTAPFVWIHQVIVGSDEGILLYFRRIAILIQGILSYYFFVTFSKKYARKAVFIASILFFIYVPDFQSFTYKQEVIWFTLLQIIFAFRYAETSKKRYLVLLAACIAANVLSFPTTILQFPFYVGFVIWHSKQNAMKKTEILKELLILFGVCGGLAVLFLGFVFSQIGIRGFVEYFPKALGDDNLDSNFLTKILPTIRKFAVLFVVTAVPMVLCEKWNWLKKFVTKYHIPVLTVLSVLAFFGQCYIERTVITWHIITYPYVLTIFMVPILCKLSGKKQNQILYYFEYPAILLVSCIALASNQSNITSMYGTVITTMALILLLDEMKREKIAVCSVQEKSILTAAICIMSVLTFGIFVYEQESVELLDHPGQRTIMTERTRCEYGPAKGLYLGNMMYDWYTGLCQMIEEQVGCEDKLLIIASDRNSALGYLYSEAEYATYSPQGGWGTGTSPKIVEYFECNPQKQPSVVIMEMEYMGNDVEEYLKKASIGAYLKEHHYEQIKQTDRFVVFRMIE